METTTILTYPPNLLPRDGEAYYWPGFFDETERVLLFSQLLEQVPWKQEPIMMFGKTVLQPRLTAWYGDAGKSYTYSGATMHPLSWLPVLESIRNRIAAVCSVHFTGALLNLYRDGQDSMGWHRDNEKELGPNPIIGSVSLGAARDFLFRHYYDKTEKLTVPLLDGSLLLMQGVTQHYWEHSLPKRKGVTGMRINITFRVL